MTDLEGVSGIDTIEMVSDMGTPSYEYAVKRLMLDVNAAIEGSFDGGATAVYVVDGHGGGNNFIKELLDTRAVQLDSEQWQELVRKGGIDTFMEVGAHAMAGTLNGFLDHTQNSKTWYNYSVNGRICGEIAQSAIFAGAFHVPFVMVSGDEAACTEARAFLGNIECAVVKYGVGRNKARLVNPDEALIKIKAAARDSLKRINGIKPYMPLLPLEIQLELCRSDMCDAIMESCTGIERLDARSVRKIVYHVKSYRDILF